MTHQTLLEATAVGVDSTGTEATPAPLRDSTKDASAPLPMPVTPAPARSLVVEREATQRSRG